MGLPVQKLSVLMASATAPSLRCMHTQSMNVHHDCGKNRSQVRWINHKVCDKLQNPVCSHISPWAYQSRRLVLK